MAKKTITKTAKTTPAKSPKAKTSAKNGQVYCGIGGWTFEPWRGVFYPEGLPQTLKLSDSEFTEEVRFLAAAKLYELGKISSGKAAKLAGLDRVSFLEKLGHYKIPAINIQAEEIEKEVKAVKSLK